MKNLLISLAVALILCGSSTLASADPAEKNVVEVTIKDMKSGYRYFSKKEPKPFNTLLKPCNGDRAYDCLYEVEGKRQKLLYRYKAKETMMIAYITETVVTVIASR